MYYYLAILFALFSFRLWANIDLINADTNSLINTLNNYQTDIDLNAIGERAMNIKYTNSNGQIAFVEFLINDRRVSLSNQGNPYYMYNMVKHGFQSLEFIQLRQKLIPVLML